MTEKSCSKCLEVKPLEAFNKHPNMQSGLLNMCRACKLRREQERTAMKITLSVSARRRIGIDPMPAKRLRGENEATPAGSDLFKRVAYVPSLHNPPVNQRQGSQHSHIKSRTPFHD